MALACIHASGTSWSNVARQHFDIEKAGLYNAIEGAPSILFVIIAGNSDSDNAFEETHALIVRPAEPHRGRGCRPGRR